MKLEPITIGFGIFQFHAFLKYYPTRFIVDFEYVQNRNIIYDFKIGQNSPKVLKLFTDYVEVYKSKNPTAKYWISGIPTSKIIDNQPRYEELCNHISKTCQIQNGYELLTPIKDRDSIHSGKKRDYSQIIPSIKFGEVQGKDIILCDDVITIGKSFLIICNHLKRVLGANSVKGIMLGKTNWLE